MTQRAVVLLSGGQDSTTCLFWAKAKFGEVHAVSINYGQRHRVELERAAEIAKLAGVASHVVLDLPALGQIADADLVREDTAIAASGGYADDKAPEGLPTSFVPGRNLLFLTLVSAVAAKLGTCNVVTGVCQTDYSGYPDCREEFVDAMQSAINKGFPSSRPIHIHTPLMHLTKADTVRLAVELGDDCMRALGRSVTCYYGKVPGCGECPACTIRARGFSVAAVADPQFS